MKFLRHASVINADRLNHMEGGPVPSKLYIFSHPPWRLTDASSMDPAPYPIDKSCRRPTLAGLDRQQTSPHSKSMDSLGSAHDSQYMVEEQIWIATPMSDSS